MTKRAGNPARHVFALDSIDNQVVATVRGLDIAEIAFAFLLGFFLLLLLFLLRFCLGSLLGRQFFLSGFFFGARNLRVDRAPLIEVDLGVTDDRVNDIGVDLALADLGQRLDAGG